MALRFLIKLELRRVIFLEGGNLDKPEKSPRRAETRTNNIHLHMTPGPCIEPGLRWGGGGGGGEEGVSAPETAPALSLLSYTVVIDFPT